MTTQAQIDANRRNAQKSTGPKTPEGKEKSSRNALWHGLAAETLVLPDEAAEDFAALHEALRDAYMPMDPAEEALVERIAMGQWRLRRVWRAEANAFREDFQSTWPDRLEKLARYEAMIERHLSRALRDLERAQNLRRVRLEEAKEAWLQELTKDTRARLAREKLEREWQDKEATERSQAEYAASHPFPELVALTRFGKQNSAERSQSPAPDAAPPTRPKG